MLSLDQQQQVFRHQMALAELLRHFWSCFPARTPQLEAKVWPLNSQVGHATSSTNTNPDVKLGEGGLNPHRIL